MKECVNIGGLSWICRADRRVVDVGWRLRKTPGSRCGIAHSMWRAKLGLAENPSAVCGPSASTHIMQVRLTLFN